ncbi:MAG: hypothetical protein ABI151_05915 [Chitinophagaceae bacterium]
MKRISTRVLSPHFYGWIRIGRKAEKNFEHAIDQSRESVTRTLRHIQDSIKVGNMASLFEDLTKEPYKIQGLGYPYFTKLFNFIGQMMNPPPNPVPLIFDKWLANAYCALSIQSGRHEDLKKYYPRIKDSKGKSQLAGEIQCKSGSVL